MMVGFVNGDSERPVNESSDERVAQKNVCSYTIVGLGPIRTTEGVNQEEGKSPSLHRERRAG